jgi:hypothetical protein
MVRIAGAVLLALVVIQFVAVEAANGPCHKFTALDQKGKKKTFNLDAITAATYTATDGQYQYEFKVCGNFNCPQVSEPTGACQETTAQGNNPMGAYPSPIVATYTTVGYPKGALTFQLGVQAGVTNPTQRTSTITIVCDPKAYVFLTSLFDLRLPFHQGIVWEHRAHILKLCLAPHPML